MKSLPLIPSSRKGFSLVEVAMAMAIFVFVLTTLLGLMSVGVNSCRESIDIGSSTQMVNAIINDLSTRRFSDLPAATQRMFFDDQGTRQGESGADGRWVDIDTPDIQSVYKAVVNLHDAPGYEGRNVLKRATIAIVAAHATDDTVDAKRYSMLIFNNDGN